MTEWKPEKNISSPWDVDAMEYNIGQPINPELTIDPEWYKTQYPAVKIGNPKLSNWNCYMFGNRPGGVGIMYTPEEGRVPNRFVRFMMKICFACTWVENK